MAKRHATRRGLSVGAALVTGLGTVGLGLFTAAPAQADVTGSLNYTCEVSDLGIKFEDPWKVDLTIGAPSSVEPGAEVPAPDITAEVTPGDDAQDQMRTLGIKSLEGTSETNYTFDGEDRTADLTVEKTDVPDEGTVTTVAEGEGKAETVPSEDGEAEITAGDFTATLTSDTGFVLNLSCVAPENNTVGAVQVGESETNDWFVEPGKLPVENNTFTVEGTAKQAGTLIVQVLDGDHEELTSYTWDVEEGEVSNSFDLVKGADYVRILSQDCVDANGDTEETPGSACNVEYKAPWADSDKGGDGQDQGDTDTGEAEQADDSGDAGQPQVPDVVQTDGGQLKSADSTNTVLALGGLLLFGAGAGAVFAARRRSEQN